MSNPQSRLCLTILEEHFGSNMAKIGGNILTHGVKTLGQISSSSGLSVREVKHCLTVLIEHGLVSFSDKRRPGVADYTLKKERVVGLLCYPRYLLLVEQYGSTAPQLLRQLCKFGRLPASSLIIATHKALNQSLPEKMTESNQILASLQSIDKVLQSLVSDKILVRCPTNSQEELDVPELSVKEEELYALPRTDLKMVLSLLNGDSEVGQTPEAVKEKKILWQMNIDTLNQKVRDELIEEGAVRRIDRPAGNIVRSILSLACSLYDPWSTVSGHLGYAMITDKIKKDWKDEPWLTHLDQYITLLSTDRTRFLDKVGDAGGGQFTINFQHILEEISSATLENIILERFGSKSVRIFRYIREKKYVEENQIQQIVMIPSKETKLLTYQLMENNLLSLQELRKSLAPNVPSKSIYLFFVNLDQVVRTCISTCFNSIYNLKKRSSMDTKDYIRLIEKSRKVESILESLNQEGASEEQCAEVEEMISPPERESLTRYQNRQEQLTLAQLHTMETLSILQTFLRYKMS